MRDAEGGVADEGGGREDGQPVEDQLLSVRDIVVGGTLDEVARGVCGGQRLAPGAKDGGSRASSVGMGSRGDDGANGVANEEEQEQEGRREVLQMLDGVSDRAGKRPAVVGHGAAEGGGGGRDRKLRWLATTPKRAVKTLWPPASPPASPPAGPCARPWLRCRAALPVRPPVAGPKPQPYRPACPAQQSSSSASPCVHQLQYRPQPARTRPVALALVPMAHAPWPMFSPILPPLPSPHAPWPMPPWPSPLSMPSPPSSDAGPVFRFQDAHAAAAAYSR